MTALGSGAGVGIVAATVGAVETVGQSLYQVLELSPRHAVELGDAGDHPALAGCEQQRPVAALPLVETLQVVAGLALPNPVPGLAGRRVGGHRRRLHQQSGIAVDRLRRRLSSRPDQSGRVLSGQPSRRQRIGDVGHPPESLRPPGSVLGLASRAAGAPAERLGGARLAGAQPPEPGCDPGLQAVQHCTGATDLASEIAETDPVQGGHVDGLHRGVEVFPHGDRPERPDCPGCPGCPGVLVSWVSWVSWCPGCPDVPVVPGVLMSRLCLVVPGCAGCPDVPVVPGCAGCAGCAGCPDAWLCRVCWMCRVS